VDTTASQTAELAEQLSAAMAAIHRRGWCDGTGGNFSCVLRWQPLELLMAPSGVDKGSVAPEQLIVVDAAGAVLKGTGQASAETALHLALVETCGAGAVLHTHSQAGTLLSQHYAATNVGVAFLVLQDLEMLKGLEGIASHATSVSIPVLGNDQDLARLRSKAEHHLAAAPYGLLIAGHGLYAWGKDLTTARRHLEILEFLLEQHWRKLLLQGLSARQHSRAVVQRHGVSHVLLDIEGTTCPVSFVSGTLFPYAANHLGSFLNEHRKDPEVQGLLAEVEKAWAEDPDPDAHAMRQQRRSTGGEGVVGYLLWLISKDRKFAPLKELQGMIWEIGYQAGELQAPLFEDVPSALRQWRAAGLHLAVYSSGSIGAQKLIYRYSSGGDLRAMFGHWFDTRIGGKREQSSYTKIARSLDVPSHQTLFISDTLAECEAAAASGMQVLLSIRPGNSEQAVSRFERISSFQNLELNP
jgi:2,3-diketo-5-methylthio-1-phosphopentane phosphatase/methylthioribulose-1-phosphate dehydratase